MKDKRKEAIALSYQSDNEAAPKVVAKGEGYIAENIMEKAKDSQVPIQEDATLVELLSELNINEQIPEELYHVVAEVFAFIYKADKDYKA
ncbi:EscU/YscU/HrcU family type III secretion system export apparatus switch protein [Halobacillus halophilus]|uniref:EscU/YscU/HrcU family type III secretion system export apparatus switch protein n=1 Tax=Halobacillus halophilus TaxID=1570 RepID=UPI001CD33464|nr:EscU/YscU/HrcU family type III secretion system export apparatus switch protein [Halobacillus halophilus]MCA1009219.1 EscU/YscU/HrcU family type III secretion system export apparatus switch protein [Halobacillus halophilus]